MFYFPETVDFSVYTTANNTGAGKDFRLNSFSYSGTWSNMDSSAYSGATSYAFTSISGEKAYYAKQAGAASAGENNYTYSYTTAGGLWINYSSLPAGYYVSSILNNESYLYAYTVSLKSYTYSYAGLDESAEIDGGSGTAITLPAAPADNEAGEKFMGWKASAATKEYSENDVLGAGTEVTLTQATTFTAQWGAPVTVTFSAGNEYGTVSPASATVGSGATYTVDGDTVTVKNGYAVLATATATPNEADAYSYNFTGWSPESGTITENTTITAGFERVALQYAVTFVNGEETFDTQNITDGECATAPTPAPTKTGYTFDGWYESGAATAFDFDTPINGALTLYAQFSANEYALTWVVGDGEIADGEYTNGDVAYGTTITAPTVNAPAGYYFYGWNAEVAATMPAEAVTYTAVYRAYAKSVYFGGYLIDATDSEDADKNYANLTGKGGSEIGLNVTDTYKGGTYADDIHAHGFYYDKLKSKNLASGNGGQFFGLKLDGETTGEGNHGYIKFKVENASRVIIGFGAGSNGVASFNGGSDIACSNTFTVYTADVAAGTECTFTVPTTAKKKNLFVSYIIIDDGNTEFFIPATTGATATAPAGAWVSSDGYTLATEGATMPTVNQKDNKVVTVYYPYAGETLPTAPAAPTGYTATEKWSDGTAVYDNGASIESGKCYKAVYYSFTFGGACVRVNNKMGVKYSALFGVYGEAMPAQKLLKALGYDVTVKLQITANGGDYTGKYKTYTYTNDELTTYMEGAEAYTYRVSYTLTGEAGALAAATIKATFTLGDGVATAEGERVARTVAQQTYDAMDEDEKALYGNTMEANYGIDQGE